MSDLVPALVFQESIRRSLLPQLQRDLITAFTDLQAATDTFMEIDRPREDYQRAIEAVKAATDALNPRPRG